MEDNKCHSSEDGKSSSEENQDQINIFTNKIYQKNNSKKLLEVKSDKNYQSNYWGTYVQWLNKGRRVKKSEKSQYRIKRPRIIDGDNNVQIWSSISIFNEDQVEKIKK